MLRDGDNTYVYGLDLILVAYGAGVQTYHLYDGLGSTTDLTDGSGAYAPRRQILLRLRRIRMTG